MVLKREFQPATAGEVLLDKPIEVEVADLYCTREHLDRQHGAGSDDAGVAMSLEELVAVGVAVWSPREC